MYYEFRRNRMEKIMKYKCIPCGWIYDEEKEGIKFADQPEDYSCPVCGTDKTSFTEVTDS